MTAHWPQEVYFCEIHGIVARTYDDNRGNVYCAEWGHKISDDGSKVKLIKVVPAGEEYWNAVRRGLENYKEGR